MQYNYLRSFLQAVRMNTEETEDTDMDEKLSLRSCMEDAGCAEASIRRAEALLDIGARDELICCLRLCRAEQLDTLHDMLRRLDRLDLLIRKTQQG